MADEGIRLSLNKLPKAVVSSSSAFNDDDDDENDDDERNSGVAKANEPPLVIPLLRKGEAAESTGANDATTQPQQKQQKQHQEQQTPPAPPAPLSDLELIMRASAATAGMSDEQKLRAQMSLLPDAPEVHSTAYRRVPVESIGRALMRGMGWQDGEGVGRTNKTVVEPVTFVRRPDRVGLGARIDDVMALPATHKKAAAMAMMGASEVRQDGTFIGLKRGGEAGKTATAAAAAPRRLRMVRVVGGKHNGVRGHLIDEDEVDSSSKLSVKVKGTEKVIRVKEKYIEDEEEEEAEPEEAAEEQVKKKQKTIPLWLRPNLIVRVIDSSIDNGRLYEQKVRVVDVVGGLEFVGETLDANDRRIVEHLSQTMVETVVPRVDQLGMCIGGVRRGRVGRVRERRRKAQQCLVRFEHEDTGQLEDVEVDFDDFCLLAQ